MKKLHEILLNALSRIDDEIIERNTLLRSRLLAGAAKRGTSARNGGRKIRVIAIAACLALLIVSASIALPLLLRPDPVPEPNIVQIEKTSQDGTVEIYTVTYTDGTKANFTVINNTANGISNITVDDKGDFSLQMVSGNAINIGQSIGLMQSGSTAPTGITGATVSTNGALSLNLANQKELALGQIEKEGELLLSAAQINEAGELTLLLPSGEKINLGRVVGEKGEDGKDGVGIAGITVNEAGELTVTLTDGTVLNLGKIKGEDGIGISESKINDAGELCLTYTDGTEVNLGRVVGEKGEDGVGIAEITLANGSDLTITLTDGTAINLGNIKGADGKSAYEIYCETYGYEGTEEEWLFDLVNGGLAIKQKFTVTFDSAGGSEVAPQEVTDGGKATEPNAPTRTGYTFLGWYLGEELWSFGGDSVTQNMTLSAKWEAIPYFLEQSNFDLQGGSFTLLHSIKRFHEDTGREETVYGFSYDFDKGLTYSIPTKEGYRFLGWTWEGQETPVKGTLSCDYEISVIASQHPAVLLGTLDLAEESPFMTANWSPIVLDTLPVSGLPVYTSDGGIALGTEVGTEVYAIADGTVVFRDSQTGTRTTILTDDGYAYHIQGMSNAELKVGDHVLKGDTLGEIVFGTNCSVLENNGIVTVPHCYLAIAEYRWSNGTPTEVQFPNPILYLCEEALGEIGYSFVKESNFDLQGGRFSSIPFIKRFHEDTQQEETIYGFPYAFDTGLTYSIPSKTGYVFLGWTWEGQSTPVKGELFYKSINTTHKLWHPAVLCGTLDPAEEYPLMTANWSPLVLDTLPVEGDRIQAEGHEASLIIGAPVGTKVRAIADGTVVYRSGGGHVTILTDDGYAYHMQGISNEELKKGDRVQKGDVIGEIMFNANSSDPARDQSVTVPHCYLTIAEYAQTDESTTKVLFLDPLLYLTEDCLDKIGYTNQ